MSTAIASLAELLGVAQAVIYTALLGFLRIGAALSLLPAFGEQSVPQRVKLIVALAFAGVVTPALLDMPVPEPSLTPLLAEVLNGLAIGAVFRLLILALQMAGAMIALATSLSQIAGGAAPEPQPAVGHLLTMAGLGLAVMAGLHVKFAATIIVSYQLLPAGTLAPSADVSAWGVGQIAQAFSLGFTLAAPFTIGALIYNLALGAINRAMPALMVSFIGAPALSWAGLALLTVLSPILLRVWVDALGQFLTNPFAMPQ